MNTQWLAGHRPEGGRRAGEREEMEGGGGQGRIFERSIPHMYTTISCRLWSLALISSRTTLMCPR